MLDRSVLGTRFTHLCSLRSILTLLARKMDEQDISFTDTAAILRLNREVAVETGHID